MRFFISFSFRFVSQKHSITITRFENIQFVETFFLNHNRFENNKHDVLNCTHYHVSCFFFFFRFRSFVHTNSIDHRLQQNFFHFNHSFQWKNRCSEKCKNWWRNWRNERRLKCKKIFETWQIWINRNKIKNINVKNINVKNINDKNNWFKWWNRHHELMKWIWWIWWTW